MYECPFEFYSKNICVIQIYIFIKISPVMIIIAIIESNFAMLLCLYTSVPLSISDLALFIVIMDM